MAATRVTTRTYAGWTMDALFAEMDRLGIPRSRYADTLVANGNRTGRWCAVQTLVGHQR